MVVALALAASRGAHAEDVNGKQLAAARAVLDAQLAALQRGDAAAFQATFVADANEPAARFPGGDAATTRAEIGAALHAWLPGKPQKLALVGQPTIQASANAAWITADLELTTSAGVAPLRLTEMIVGLYDYSGKANAIMISAPVADAQLAGAAPPKPPPAKIDPKDLDGRLASPRQLLKEIDYDASRVAIGSAPGEHGFGADADKLLKSWASLKLSLVGDPIVHEDEQMMTYGMGQVSMARAGKPPVTLDVLVIAVHDVTQDGARPWHVESVHYAAHTLP